MRNLVKVSIIVPIYNGEDFVEHCCKQLANQTLDDIEIILINDGSSDRSGQLCDLMVNKYTKCRVYHQSNRGVSVARNRGISMANGEFVGFVDVDDRYDEDMYEILYNLAISKKAEIACFDKVGRDGEITVLESSEKALKEFFLGKIAISSCNKIYKKRLYPQFSFPEGICIYEDCMAVYKALESAHTVACINLNKYHYVHRENSSSIAPFSNKFFDAIDIIDKIETDINTSYSQLEEYVSAKKVNVYLRISKIYYMRGAPKECKDRIAKMRQYLATISPRMVLRYMKKTNIVRYFLYLYCSPLFKLLVKTIDNR